MDLKEIAKALGRRGGHARAARLSVEDRRRIASLGGEARRRSRQTAQRITDNLHYVTAVAELRGRAPEVKRLKTFSGRLPGVYLDETPGSSAPESPARARRSS